VRVVEVEPLAVEPKAKLALKVGKEKRAELEVATGTSCSATVKAAQRAIEVVLPDALKRLSSNLMFETIVDGAVWRPASSICRRLVPGDSWQGKGKELVYAVCNAKQVFVQDTGLSSDRAHWVQMRVRAPGSKTVLETPKERFTLHCPPVGTSTPTRPDETKKPGGCNGCAVGAGEPTWRWLLLVLAMTAWLRKQRD